VKVERRFAARHFYAPRPPPDRGDQGGGAQRRNRGSDRDLAFGHSSEVEEFSLVVELLNRRDDVGKGRERVSWKRLCAHDWFPA